MTLLRTSRVIVLFVIERNLNSQNSVGSNLFYTNWILLRDFHHYPITFLVFSLIFEMKIDSCQSKVLSVTYVKFVNHHYITNSLFVSKIISRKLLCNHIMKSNSFFSTFLSRFPHSFPPDWRWNRPGSWIATRRFLIATFRKENEKKKEKR